MVDSFPKPWPAVEPRPHTGRFITLVPTDAESDAGELFAISHGSDACERLWQFLHNGPFCDVAAMRDWIIQWQSAPDVVCFTVRAINSSRALGMISILRITPAHGVAELGCIWYAPAAQRSSANTEAVYLLLCYLFNELQYRRVEWKCDSRNEPSKAAALRLGFQFEGLFRQHMAIKGINRDTAWFSILDGEWPRLRANFEHWLHGEGRVSLRELNHVRP
ncbi:MAG: Protein N-acetyltransferase, RimJ/RimL family [Chthoniobacteraceae bacterium]|nr:Protein N-acetyltransferase, RimJ/RimL family [Chthoniobacteraceae bacterium]